MKIESDVVYKNTWNDRMYCSERNKSQSEVLRKLVEGGE